MRRALIAVALLLLTGCETSNLDRSASVVVSGRVLRPDGSPAGGVPVALERDPSVGETLTGILVVPLTLFTACLADPPPRLCRGRSIKHATTAADGSYSFNLTGRETQTAFGNAVSFSLSTELAPQAGEQSGAALSAGFRIQTEHLRLPDLQAWQPAVTVAAGRVSWAPAVPGGGEYQVVVEDAGGQLVWPFDGARTDVAFDPRILEDTAGTLAVTARTRSTAEGTTVSVLRRSGRVAYRSAAGPPASRGRPCARGPAATPVAPCPLTDGDFTTRLPGAATATTSTSTGATVAPAADTATIDLGRAADVSLIVVRGCSCQVERSTDGQAWTAVGRSSGFAAVVPSRTGPARYVRLTGTLTDLAEVSVWEGAAPPPQPPPAANGGPVPPPPAARAAPERSRQAPALVALVALVAAAIGLAAGARALRSP